MCNPYDIENYDWVSRQPPDHMAKTRFHGKKRVTRDKSGTKRDLQELNGDPGYGVTVHLSFKTLTVIVTDTVTITLIKIVNVAVSFTATVIVDVNISVTRTITVTPTIVGTVTEL